VCWSTNSLGITNGTDRDIVYVPISINQPSPGGDPVGGGDDAASEEDVGILLLIFAAIAIVAVMVIVVYYYTKM
jgi:hypothetical protein